MVATDVVRSVLSTVADRLPDHEPAFVNCVDIRRGWGDAVQVRLHTRHLESPANHVVAARLVAAVQNALEPHRHQVMIVWESAWPRP